MWQQKRLEIMNRDEFTCQSCQSTDKTLNVHHIYYEKNKAPWDYEDDLLITWCEDCHTERHDLQKKILLSLSRCAIDELKSIYFLAETNSNVLNIVSSMYLAVPARKTVILDNILINMIDTVKGWCK